MAFWKTNGDKKDPFLRIIFVLACTIVIVAAIWMVDTFIFTRQSAGYQAVFLTNGQVYFGHLQKRLGGDYVKLTSVYYLRVEDQGQTATDATADTQSQVSIIKLGGEVHGPKDAMLINKDQILFIEDLREDSDIVRNIKASQ